MRSLCSLVIACALSAAPATALAQAAESWATSGARSLLEQGEAEDRAGRPDQAAARYLEAIRLDGTFRAAYLALGALRERSGDVREAERVYSAGLERVPGFWQGSLARARLRKRLGRRDEARDDLADAARVKGNDVALLEELALWQVEDGRFLQALQLCRRLRRWLEEGGDPQAMARVQVRIKALGILAAEQDVLRARHPDAGPTRRAIEAIARRSGW